MYMFQELIAECLNFIYYPEDKPIEIFDVISGKVIAGVFKTIEDKKRNENVSFECYDKKNFILKYKKQSHILEILN